MRKFGVEIELIGLDPRSAADVIRAAGIDCQYAGYTHSTVNYWKVVTDASIGSSGCEVVSPPLQGDQGMIDLEKVLNALNNAGAGIRRSCGLHVHIDARGLTAADIANVVHRYGRHEADIDAIMPPSRRGDSNSYARSMVGRHLYGETVADVCSRLTGRYWKVNLASYVKYRTIEFRQHSGTVDAAKVRNWVLFLQAFVEKSIVPVAANTQPTASVVDRINADRNPTHPSNLNRSQRSALPHLQDGWLNAQGIAYYAFIAESSVSGLLSGLRRAGYSVQRRRSYNGANEYTVTNRFEVNRPEPAPVARQTVAYVDPGLWAGVDPSVVSFYAARRVALQAA